MSAEEDYAEAQRRIAKAREREATELNFNFLRDLDRFPPEISGMTRLRSVQAGLTRVSDLSPLQSLSNLQTLLHFETQVSDLSPLQGLSNLQTLDLNNTPVSDLAPLQGLSNLLSLDLDTTQVSDLSPLQGLSNLQTIYLDNTQVSDLAPLQGLPNLQSLILNDTQVSDLTPLQDLTKLYNLNLNNTYVLDLRPLRSLEFKKVGRLFFVGLSFENTPALLNETLQLLADIVDNTERTQKTLAYLRTLPPPPAPLPWEIDDALPDGPPPQTPNPDTVPALVWTETGALDVAPTPPGATEQSDPIRQSLYDRLPPAVEKLWRSGNRYSEVDGPARALRDLLTVPFAEADILSIHLEVAALTDVLDGDQNRPQPERLDPDCRAALTSVLRLAPGVTIGHPDVDLMETRNREYARRQLPPTVAEGERRITAQIANDPDLPTERTREFARRSSQAADSGRVAEIRSGFTRNVVIALASVASALGDAAVGFVATEVVINSARFLIANKEAIMAVAPSWGETGFAWAEYILIRAKQIVNAARS